MRGKVIPKNTHFPKIEASESGYHTSDNTLSYNNHDVSKAGF